MIRMSRNVSIFSVAVVMTFTVLATVAVAFAAQGEGGNGQHKITICHKGHVITVANPAWPAHDRHGDTIIQENPEDTSIQENPDDACGNEGAPPEEPPTLTTDASNNPPDSPATLPTGTISDTATLDVPDGATGTIEFKLYGPFTTAPTATDCVAANLETEYDTDGAATVQVVNHNVTGAGNTSNPYTSPSFTPTQTGIYQWTATFTPDSGDPSGEIGCGEATEQSVVDETSS
jgi:hypothetical protein